MRQERSPQIDIAPLPQTLSTRVLEIPQDLVEDFTVTIRGEERIRRITEPLVIPHRWEEIASNLGKNLYHFFDILERRILEEDISGSLLKTKGAFSNFVPAADILVSNTGEWKLLEINTRPSSLGGFCLISDLFNDNQYRTLEGLSISKALIEQLESTWGNNYQNTTALVSHPAIAFYRQHRALAQTLGIPVATFQDAQVSDSGLLVNGEPTENILRQASSRAFFDPDICDQSVVQFWSENGFNMLPGPYNQLLGEKSALVFFPEPEKWLPSSFIAENSLSVRDYRGCWLKGRGGGTEAAVYLSKSMTKGTRKGFLDAMISEDLETAEKELEKIGTSSDGRLFSKYLAAAKSGQSDQWIIQEDVELLRINVDGVSGMKRDLRTMLRVHFIPSRDANTPCVPFMQMYADSQRRVNASGYTIPLKFE